MECAAADGPPYSRRAERRPRSRSPASCASTARRSPAEVRRIASHRLRESQTPPRCRRDPPDRRGGNPRPPRSRRSLLRWSTGTACPPTGFPPPASRTLRRGRQKHWRARRRATLRACPRTGGHAGRSCPWTASRAGLPKTRRRERPRRPRSAGCRGPAAGRSGAERPSSRQAGSCACRPFRPRGTRWDRGALA